MDGPTDIDARGAAFQLGEWLVEPELNRLDRGVSPIHLRPKVMDVLVALARHEPGETVRKEELVDEVWPEAAVADSVLFRAVFELREALGDDPRAPHAILTVPRQGYRLLLSRGEVTAAAPPPEVRHERVPESTPSRAGRGPSASRAVLAAFGLGVILTMTCLLPGHGTTLPLFWGDRSERGLLVLPFAQEGTPWDPYLAAGITDEVVGRLVGRSSLDIVVPSERARAGVTAADLPAVGRRHGVRRVLAGTVVWPEGRREGPRVEARVVNVATGTVEWEGAYTLLPGRPLAMQGTLAATLTDELLVMTGALVPGSEPTPGVVPVG